MSVFLLREGIGPGKALRSKTGLKRHDVSLGAISGELWVKRSPPDDFPSWVTFLGVEDQLPASWKPQALSAVLFFELDGRMLAITFGQGGRFLLDGDAYERGFGLKAALNTVAPDRVRGMSALTLGGYGVRTERQAGRDAPVAAFEHDELRDLVGGLGGAPEGIDGVRSIRGRDGASITAAVTRNGVPSVAAQLLKLQSSTKYKASYGFADNIVPLEPAEAETHDRDLVERLRAGKVDGVGLHPPEVFDDANTVGYSLSTDEPDPENFGEASVEALADELKAKKNLEAAVTRLKRLRLWAVPADGSEIPRWSAHRCLTFEQRISGSAVILFDGRWWTAANDLVDVVDQELASLPRAKLSLPEWDKSTRATEGAYNAHAAATASWFNLDQKTVRVKGRSAIEVCDLLTPQRELVHVKSYGGSSVLSHLFAQGSVSAELLLAEPEFRDEVRKKITTASFKDLIPGQNSTYDPGQFTIVYAIAAEGDGLIDDVIPFFSRVHLRTHAVRLRRLGYPAPSLQRFRLLPSRRIRLR